jgi:hypothetical protein
MITASARTSTGLALSAPPPAAALVGLTWHEHQPEPRGSDRRRTAARPEYSVPSGAAIAEPRRTTLLDRYATILAYCVATQAGLVAAVWHGAPGLGARAVTLAQAAWDATVAARAGTTERPGWRATWGYGPASRAAIVAPPASLLIGDGSSAYGPGRGWPPHQDHIHVRLR